MKVLVTGSSGHLGEALMRTLRDRQREAIGLDIVPGPFTTITGNIDDAACVSRCMKGVQVVFHAAALHKPHLVTHSRQAFVNTNISGTLNLLEEAAREHVEAFIFTSTTSVFGDALVPPPGAPSAWITEEVRSVPKNIYGVTKAAAEDLCQLFHRNQRMPCIVLRASRFFPEQDDSPAARSCYVDDNLKANEFLFRRVEISDVVSAHLFAAGKAPQLGFGRYVISATPPFTVDDLVQLRSDAARVVQRHAPGYESEYARRNWKMMPTIDRVYVNDRARRDLGWSPRYDFRLVIEHLKANNDILSPLARAIGSKGYHAKAFSSGGPYPVDELPSG